MSSLHCVVVWEWQAGEAWLPHGPGVARTLERAHAKRLTRVVLADAEPALRGHTVNLRTLTQTSEAVGGAVVERAVRRATYSVHSPGARGARWEWADKGSTRYDPLPMSAQCALEDAWAAGEGSVQLEGWYACLGRMELCAAGARPRVLRRALQPPYPLARAPHAPPLPTRQPHQRTDGVHATIARIPMQHTGSSVQSVQSAASARSDHSTLSARSDHSTLSARSDHSTLSARSTHSTHSAPVQRRPRSVSPKERRGLARQILSNLNIFSNTPSQPREPPRPPAQAEEAVRRHSVDTVSTYLSHESKDSLQSGQVGSVGELLDVSAGSDEVFTSDTEGLGRGAWGVWARAVEQPQWGAVCPCCMQPLRPRGAGPTVLQLNQCLHQLCEPCLTTQLTESGRLECMVCGTRYPPSAPPLPAAPPLVPPQPAGSMAWSVQGAALPTHPHHNTIIVTYKFQSGRQSAGHPVPGAPYYAVGFPRHSVLPNTQLGRKVLDLLVAAWGGSGLFTVHTSQTTGREHVVAWRLVPPPHSARSYATLTQERADAELQAAANRLRALIGQPTDTATDV